MSVEPAVVQKDRAAVGVRGSDIVIVILALLAVLSVTAGVGRLILGFGATTSLNDGVSWGIWIAFDFLLIAFAGTGFSMAALVHVFRQEQFNDALRPAILAAFMGYIAVFYLLVLDLGRPDRFYHFIISWNIHSPLFEVSWCILLYTMVLVVENSPVLFEKLKWEWPVRMAFRVLPVVAIIGVTLSSLHQSSLGSLYLNMPHRIDQLWYSPILPILFFVSSIMAGFSVAIIAYIASTRIVGRETKPEIVTGLGKLVGWISVLYAIIKLGDFALAGELPALFRMDTNSLLMLAELGLGAIVPAALLLVPSLRARPFVQWGAPVLVMLGVLANRFSITLFAQRFPAGASYLPTVVEWLATIGIVAGVTLAWYFGIKYLVVFDSKAERKYHH